VKYLGQYIQNLKSRFRSSVYLESVEDSGSSADNFLMKESDGKVGYRSLKTYGVENQNADNSFKVGLIPGADAGDPGGFKFLKADGTWRSPLGYVAGNGIDISGASISIDSISNLIANDGANRVLTSDGDGTLSAEANMTFDGATLALGGFIEQDTVIELNNDDNSVKLGISDGTNSIAIGDADGDFVINSTGAHNLVFATSNFERFKIESGGGCAFAGDLKVEGTISNSAGTSIFSNNVVIGTVDLASNGLSIGEASPTIQLFDTTNDAKLLIYSQDSSSVIGTYSNHALFLYTNSTQALSIDTSQNTIFAGDITVSGNDIKDSGGNVVVSSNGSGVGTFTGNLSGNAATVTTNANLTGHITSTGNATVLGSFTIAQLSAAISNASISGNNTGDQTNVSGSAGSCTGNAATATTLETARDIGGVSFNGSASIDLPGVNTAGNQNTSGTAAGLSATLSVNNGGTGATTFASNSLLTGNSTSAIQAEAELTYDSDTLLIGPDDLTASYIKKKSHGDGAGGSLQIYAADGGGTNKTGGILAFYSGASTGTASGGNMRFYTCPPTADSDADVNSHELRMSIGADGVVNFNNNVVKSFHRKLTPTSTSTSGDADGDVVYFGNGPSGGSTTAGYIYFYKGTGAWELADADSTTLGGNGFLAVSIGTDPSTDGMLIRGMVTHHVEIEGTEGDGAILYLSTTAGVATVDPPTNSGDLVRIIGYALDTDNDQMYFNPSMDWIEIA
tara:strand:- start:894 stop:3104 length:2211 start_codon:yes stop_codon:yes gene_type:complete